MLSRARVAVAILVLLCGVSQAARKDAAKSEGGKKKDEGPLKSATFTGLALRGSDRR